MGNRTQNSIRNIFFAVVDRLVTMLVPFVIRTIMIKTLGPEYLGLSNLFASVLTVLSLAELGVGQAMVYAMYRPVAEGNKTAVCALLNLYRTIYNLIGSFILIAGLMLMPFLRGLIEGDIPADLNLYIVYLLSLANTVFSYFFGAYKSSLMTAMQREDINSNASTISHTVVYIFAIVGLLTTRNYYLYAALFPLGTILQNLIRSHYADKCCAEYLCFGRVNRKVGIDIFRKVLALIGHKLGWVISSSIDNLCISAFLGLTAIAMYGNYNYVANSLFMLIVTLCGGIRPSVGNSMVLENREKNYRDFVTVNFLYMLITGVCCACLVSLYQHFIRIWVGDSYLFGFDMVILFTTWFYIRNSRQITVTYKDTVGIWEMDALRPYAEGFTNLVLSVVLAKVIGAPGIILATIISMLFVGMPWESITVLKYVFHGGYGAYAARYLYYALATVAACFAGYRVCGLFPDTGILVFLVKGVVCAVVAAAVLVVAYLPLPEFKSAVALGLKVIRKHEK
ncbi:MAG: oligosaccharide flippase family protein [Eubacteriales bacterium]|nr:oligosaccharide flippase family protein [Eubacteriales bacterium]